jgi:hypothetical protein
VYQDLLTATGIRMVTTTTEKKVLYQTRSGNWLTAKLVREGVVNRKGHVFAPRNIKSRGTTNQFQIAA